MTLRVATRRSALALWQSERIATLLRQRGKACQLVPMHTEGALRPPLSLQRLSMGEGGRLLYQMKRPRNGALVLSLTPDEFLAKLATLVPPPRVHSVRYHGLFAPHSKLRSRVVPSASPAAGAHAHASPAGPLGSLMLSVLPAPSPPVASSGGSAIATQLRTTNKLTKAGTSRSCLARKSRGWRSRALPAT